MYYGIRKLVYMYLKVFLCIVPKYLTKNQKSDKYISDQMIVCDLIKATAT